MPPRAIVGKEISASEALTQFLMTEVKNPANLKLLRATAVFGAAVLVFRQFGEAIFAA
ncbi:hypothetical protein FOA52_007337 [Chlamydomonas sp. UWO 241]|nr:hypothetical protein FOA52_007337 [Chlamydomonas sp. UWO 241]